MRLAYPTAGAGFTLLCLASLASSSGLIQPSQRSAVPRRSLDSPNRGQ